MKYGLHELFLIHAVEMILIDQTTFTFHYFVRELTESHSDISLITENVRAMRLDSGGLLETNSYCIVVNAKVSTVVT